MTDKEHEERTCGTCGHGTPYPAEKTWVACDTQEEGSPATAWCTSWQPREHGAESELPMPATGTDHSLCPRCKTEPLVLTLERNPLDTSWLTRLCEGPKPTVRFAALVNDDDGFYCPNCHWFRSFLHDRQDAAELEIPTLVTPRRPVTLRAAEIDVAEGSPQNA